MNACAVCGESIKADFRFCPGCGTALTPSVSESPQRGPGAAQGTGPDSNASTRVFSGSATSPARNRNAMAPQIPANAERKFVTVLFADLCGSTSHIADFDPEEAKDYLENALRLMSDAIHEYGGTVSQLLGDGLIALFGAPLAFEDHAIRACLAGIAIQNAVAGATTAVSEQSLIVRVGIHSGEVVVGPANDDIASFYRADGTTIHIASRIEQLARPSTILISEDTHRLIAPQLHAQSIGPCDIRGVARRIELFELPIAYQPLDARPFVGNDRLTTMIGRRDVLAALRADARDVSASGVRVRGLCGDAGIGKSRLLAELNAGLSEDEFTVRWIGARTWFAQVPYSMIAALTADLLGFSSDASFEEKRRLARLEIAQWPTEHAWHRAAIGDLLDLDKPPDAWRALAPAQRRRQISDTLLWLIESRHSSRPLVIMLDDAHNCDRDSLRLLESLFIRLARLPVLFCISYRSDFELRFQKSTAFHEYRLEPLPVDDMRGLVESLLGTHPSLQALTDKLLARADGNPLFLEQIAMTMIDDGTLAGSAGSYQCVRDVDVFRVPGTITAIIGARVDRLPPPAKAVLEAAAIVAEPIDSELAAHMQEISPVEAGNHLALAAGAGLLVTMMRDGVRKYRFSHALVQETVSASLTSRRRKALHRAACAALQRMRPSRTGDLAGVLAHHAWHGESWQLAVDSALEAMPRSIKRSANRDALRMFELGLDSISHLPSTPDLQKKELDLRLKALGAQLPMREIDAIVSNLENAELIAEKVGLPRHQANALLQLAFTQWVRGGYSQGLEASARAGMAASTIVNRGLEMAATQLRMMLNHGLGRYREVLTDARYLEAHYADELGTGEFIPGWAVLADVNAKAFMTDALWRMGRFDAAQTACDAAYRKLAANDHAFSRAMIDFSQAELLLAQQRWPAALALLEQTMASCREHDLLSMVPAILATLAGAKALNGQADEARIMLDKATADRVDLQGGRYNAFYFPKNMAIILAVLGRFDAAIESATDARLAAAATEQRGHEVEAIALMAEIARLRGDQRSAEALRDEAHTIAVECHAVVLERGLATAIANDRRVEPPHLVSVLR